MLVLSRKVNQRIMLSNGVVITVVGIRGDKTRIGIEAPTDVEIVRDDAKQQHRLDSGTQRPAPPVNPMENGQAAHAAIG